jgi:hypothetical protein
MADSASRTRLARWVSANCGLLANECPGSPPEVSQGLDVGLVELRELLGPAGRT